MKKKKFAKNLGLKISPPKPEDYILGGFSKLPKVVLQKNGQWDDFLPLPEFQALGVETYACVSFGTLSAVEMLIKRLYNE